MKLILLALEFIKIGAFSFGGGLGTLPYIYEMAEKTGWIETDYISRILAVSQVTPGPLACNIGSIVGFRVSGILGAFVANLGFVLPAICFMGLCYKIVNKIKDNEKANKAIKIVRSAALAIMVGSSTTLFENAFLLGELEPYGKNMLNIVNYKSVILGIGIFFLSRWKKLNSLWLIFISACVSVLIGV